MNAIHLRVLADLTERNDFDPKKNDYINRYLWGSDGRVLLYKKQLKLNGGNQVR